jgi:hypothetical protein
VCPHCGYDVHSRQAERVRQLREAGQIHPGRLTPQERSVPGEEVAPVRGGRIEELPAEDLATEGPEEIQGGL